MNHLVLMAFPEPRAKSVEGARGSLGEGGFVRIWGGDLTLRKFEIGTPTDNAAATTVTGSRR